MGYDPTGCIVVCLVFVVAAWLFTAVRLYVRIHFGKGPFLDDLLAVFAMFLFTAYTLIFTYCQFVGSVPLAIHPSPESGREGLKHFFICDMLYTAGTYLMKLSFTCMLLRLVQTTLQFVVLFVIMISGAAVTLASIIHASLFCHPPSYHWNRFDNPSAQGHCEAFWSRMVMTLVQGVWIMAADIILGLVIPFMLLWGMRMHPRTKLSIRVLLGLGSLASIATIIRLVYLGIATNPQISWAIIPIAFWSIIEQGVSILCIAAATWKPLFVKLGALDPRDESPVLLQTRDVLGDEAGFHDHDNDAFGSSGQTGSGNGSGDGSGSRSSWVPKNAIPSSHNTD
ncbi:uncharacterized protein BJX67DRAFT_369981 [Aspergillus lucknowensis]|uniref:Rhodopsin domain-containing protein n=1 Tax=Aspergillus lucknowensis TaxID=176173 RepID=A0ABR4M3J5_9EURO